MDSALIIDGIVIALLAATIFYAFRLERKLETLRSAQAAFAETIRELNVAASRAEAGIQGMKVAAATSGQALDERIKRARSVGDELGLLMQAGQRTAQRVDAVRSVPQPAVRPAPEPAVRPQQRSASEALRAIGAMR